MRFKLKQLKIYRNKEIKLITHSISISLLDKDISDDTLLNNVAFCCINSRCILAICAIIRDRLFSACSFVFLFFSLLAFSSDNITEAVFSSCGEDIPRSCLTSLNCYIIQTIYLKSNTEIKLQFFVTPSNNKLHHITYSLSCYKHIYNIYRIEYIAYCAYISALQWTAYKPWL